MLIDPFKIITRPDQYKPIVKGNKGLWYMRYSQEDKDRASDTIKKQMALGLEVMKKEGVDISDIEFFTDEDEYDFDDVTLLTDKNKSGSWIYNRPRLILFLEKICSGDYKVAGAKALSRVSRRLYHQEHIVELCKQLGVKLVFPQDESAMKSEEMRLFTGLMNQVRLISDSKAQAQAIKQTIRLGKPTGSPPIGYEVVYGEENGKRRATHWQHTKQIKSVKSLFEEFLALGLEHCIDKFRFAQNRNDNRKRVLAILQNPIYAGKYNDKRHGLYELSDEYVKPIIKWSIFEKSLQKLSDELQK